MDDVRVLDTKEKCSRLTTYSRTPHLRPPPKSEWSGLKRGVVSREGFGYFHVLDQLMHLCIS